MAGGPLYVSENGLIRFSSLMPAYSKEHAGIFYILCFYLGKVPYHLCFAKTVAGS